MKKLLRHGQKKMVMCHRHGCKVEGTIVQYGIKWIAKLKCGHTKFIGYVKDLRELKAKGWTRNFNELPEDPRIERNKKHNECDQQTQRKEMEEYAKTINQKVNYSNSFYKYYEYDLPNATAMSTVTSLALENMKTTLGKPIITLPYRGDSTSYKFEGSFSYASAK